MKFEKLALNRKQGWFRDFLKEIGKAIDTVIREEDLSRLVADAIREIDATGGDLDPYSRAEAVTGIVVGKVDELIDFRKITIRIGKMPIPGAVLETFDGPVIRLLIEGLVTRLVLAELARREAPAA